MENYFFTNLAILVILLASLFPFGFFFIFNYKLGRKNKKMPTVNLESLDSIDKK